MTTPKDILTTIKEAQEKQLKELDLSNHNLIQIPKEVFELEQIELLDLKGNNIREIPQAILQLNNLKSLNIVGNQLTEAPKLITKLTNLNELNLGSNQLTTVPESITHLINLNTLSLRNNQLKAVPESITHLINLTTLDLRSNQLKTVPESITKLINLSELNLSSNKLTTVPESIANITNLNELNLSSNQLTTVPEFIAKLTNLNELNLSFNQLTTVPKSIANLTNLTKLHLSSNQLTTIPKLISKLVNLTALELSSNQLKIVPESITKLTNLVSLNLSSNQLTTVPESITKLTNLTAFNLNCNQLKTVPESITNLTNLTSLNLTSSQLTTIPESITKLTNLVSLNLSSNQLKTVPESITNLTNLMSLNLSSNQLTTVPESITNLTNLMSLNLSSNQLTTIPESITNLTNLTSLNLSPNQLMTIPESITNLANLTVFDLRKNPLETPPIEIAEQGIEAIKNYFRQLEIEGRDYIYEAKLLIVGEGGAGKTTLVKKIQNQDCQLLQNEKSTEGIDVIPWSFPLDNGRDFRVNIWDFGGQVIYHATHQFFLTKRSLYILVIDTRKEDTDFYYWLNAIELLSDNSPILIIKNEKQDRKKEINEHALRGEFGNLKETLATNLATDRGLHDIITNIQAYIRKLPHIGQTLPKTWIKVREALEKDSRHYIPLQEYFDICQDNGFTRLEDKLQLSEYLHDLGVCLHFKEEEDSLLYKIVILNPKWGTDAVYKVLDNPQVIENQGNFNRDDLKNIWQEKKYAPMRGELLELMKKFQLCYEIPECKNTFIAPQLLPENQPEYNWDESNNLILRYAYPAFMPKGIVTRFIVAMHEYIDQQQYVWRSGVILNKDNTKAAIIENYSQREMKIRVVGSNKRDFMTIVAHEIDKINNSYKRLKYQKLIPCNCNTCRDNQSPYFYDFQILRNFLSDNQEAIQCQKSYHMVNVLSLIDDLVDTKQTIGEEEEETKISEPQRDNSFNLPKIEVNIPMNINSQTMANNELQNIKTQMNVSDAQVTNMVGNNQEDSNKNIDKNESISSPEPRNPESDTVNSEQAARKKWYLSYEIPVVTLLVSIILALISGILTDLVKGIFQNFQEKFIPTQETESLEPRELEQETNNLQ